MRQFLSALCAGLGRADGARHRRRDAAQRRRPAGLRRGGLADRGAPPRRPRRDHRVGLRHRGRRADRRDARRRRRGRHPDGDRRRPLHRRDRLLRLRREQGRGDAAAGRASTTTTWPAATPTATRSPTCTCSRRSATRYAVNPDRELRREATRAAGRCWCSPGRSRCAAGCGCRRPPPTLAGAGAAERRGGRRARSYARAPAGWSRRERTRPGPVCLVGPPGAGVQRDHNSKTRT